MGKKTLVSTKEYVLGILNRFCVPLFLRIMVSRNFLPALSMELLFFVAALRYDVMFRSIRFLILVFLKVVCIRGMMKAVGNSYDKG